jgi:hypothetical protein
MYCLAFLAAYFGIQNVAGKIVIAKDNSVLSILQTHGGEQLG